MAKGIKKISAVKKHRVTNLTISSVARPGSKRP